MRLSILILAAILGAAPAARADSIAPQSSSNPQQKFEKRNGRIKPVDCHRDVRTHRIGGVKVTHRHVGDNCQIRQVRKAN